ncbi:MAG: ABC transporter, permease protein 1 (cluster 1, maltose/g3p/polyamine/iron) [uncultured Thermomicrobiales bacterium]|uniref:ABC transporter, permease protein 1 (Cluster 1, maltose/g3p/polyamine/iron) n=1 Tax=uncultured Thermomicrobiales bacterium TaxID=1645740 RepID=A0A6J4U9H3_9BACT|nr:MAG: ABC transporter, permease protein 1 (cluster 1, maltose/g3p/polyamine/iron) [uncultured Thermomicrobiales bacterium]
MAGLPIARPIPAGAAKRRRISDEALAGWISISPWLLGFVVFTGVPLLASLYFSFTKYDVIRSPEWVGLDNYRRLLTNDRLFPLALRNTFTYALMAVPLDVATSLGAALLLNQARRWQGVFRTIYYLPAITPAVATSYLFIWILNPNAGLLNRGLRFLHLPAPQWTVDPFWIKPTIVISQLWVLGGSMIILLAALKQVPAPLYEAAWLDGAGRWRRFKDVTLPMISGVLFFVATVGTINALQVFTQGYVMFDKNGGPEQSALFIVMYLYNRAFGTGTFQMGYAAAIAWILFVIVVAITVFQFRLSKRWVYYESGDER